MRLVEPAATGGPGRIALLLLFVVGAAAGVRAGRLPIKTYTIVDGLPRDEAHRIVRDSKGFLWLCTIPGLSRFDGYSFTNYGADQGLPNRHVSDFLETRSGVYWVATYGGLCQFNVYPSPPSGGSGRPPGERKFSLYHLGDDPDSQIVTVLREDRAGTVWCGTVSGLYRLDELNGHWTSSLVELHQPSGANKPPVVSILEDSRGSLWISTSRGLFRRRPDGITELYTAQEGLPYQNPRFETAILEEHEGRIWFGTNLGLYQLVAEPQPNRPVVARVYTAKDGLDSDNVNCLFEASDGKFWVSTWSALNEYLPDDGKDGRRFRSYNSANGVTEIISLGEDRDGNLWIGTESHGIMKVVRSGFTTYGEAEGLGATGIGQISEDRAGKLCVFSGKSGTLFFNRLDGEKFTAVPVPLPKGVIGSWGWYQCVLQDREGEWWVSTGSGLIRYPKVDRLEQLTHARPTAIYTTKDGLTGDYIFRVFEDSRGDVWIGTISPNRNILTRWERATGAFHRYSPADGVPLAAPSAFCEDGVGNLWIGFYAQGLARYRDGRFTRFGAADGLPGMPDGFVRGLYLDHAGRLWAAISPGGLVRVDNPGAERPEFVTYGIAEGLGAEAVTCITEDRLGYIYAGTARGLDRLDPATGHVKHYTAADGLAQNFINVAFQDRNGVLWFGTLDGLSRLIPAPDPPPISPPILISGVQIAGVARSISNLGETEIRSLELGPSQNTVQIDFLSLRFRPGEVIRYQYKLEGTQQDWSTPTDQRSITYANLSPGRYKFLVRAVSTDGTVSQSPAVLYFRISPPLWLTWWFLGSAALLAGAAIYLLYRYRLAQLLELERVRTRIATDLHDDIGSALSQIAILSEVAQKQLPQPQTAASTPLGRIAHLSRESVDAMSDIVWAINPLRDRLSDLTHRMRFFANEVLPPRGIQVGFRALEGGDDQKIDAETRRQVFLIFKECITNVVRHSACAEVDIEFSNDRGGLRLAVRDDGRGFDPVAVSHGHGLASLRERARALGGGFEIESYCGRGTTVTLNVPHRAKPARRLTNPPV